MLNVAMLPTVLALPRYMWPVRNVPLFIVNDAPGITLNCPVAELLFPL